MTAGYDWQDGDLVYGIAGDLMFGDLSGSAPSTTSPGFACGAGCGFDISAIAMVRGRVGYAYGDFLPYATAGVALTRATALRDGTPDQDGTLTNLVLGAGVDYRMSETETLGFEVLYLVEGGGDHHDFSNLCSGCRVGSYSSTIARGSVAYRF